MGEIPFNVDEALKQKDKLRKISSEVNFVNDEEVEEFLESLRNENKIVTDHGVKPQIVDTISEGTKTILIDMVELALKELFDGAQRVDDTFENYKVTAYRIDNQGLYRIDVRRLQS